MFSIFYSWSCQNIIWQEFFFSNLTLSSLSKAFNVAFIEMTLYAHISSFWVILMTLNKLSGKYNKYKEVWEQIQWIVVSISSTVGSRDGWACWRVTPSTSPDTAAFGLLGSGCFKLRGIDLAKCDGGGRLGECVSVMWGIMRSGWESRCVCADKAPRRAASYLDCWEKSSQCRWHFSWDLKDGEIFARQKEEEESSVALVKDSQWRNRQNVQLGIGNELEVRLNACSGARLKSSVYCTQESRPSPLGTAA